MHFYSTLCLFSSLYFFERERERDTSLWASRIQPLFLREFVPLGFNAHAQDLNFRGRAPAYPAFEFTAKADKTTIFLLDQPCAREIGFGDERCSEPKR